ncbi:MAG: LytTR family DNA-binding domain-containing protein [Roseburia sp.]|nr:LytTR family DNA-binding domain-containing protein [Roseburia sp.]
MKGVQMIKIAICDDNSEEMELSREIVANIMKGYTIPYEITEFETGEKLLHTDLDFHLVFLDIIMGEKNGIEVGNEIYRRNRRTKIIFQTNYIEYCQDAINISHAFAFLEKPLTEEEVQPQIEVFIENNVAIENPSMEFQNVIYVGGDKKKIKPFVRLPIQDIMYFEYMKAQKKIKIVTKDSSYIYKAAMNAVEERMKPFRFAISCRGILVNLENIEKIQGYKVYLKNGESVSLSQKRVREFKQRVQNYI